MQVLGWIVKLVLQSLSANLLSLIKKLLSEKAVYSLHVDDAFTVLKNLTL